jgi:hypothetical protein
VPLAAVGHFTLEQVGTSQEPSSLYMSHTVVLALLLQCCACVCCVPATVALDKCC